MIRSLSLEPYRLEWEEATGSAHDRFRVREGCVLTVESDSGRRGKGEAAPLPSRSRETLEDCRAALAELTPAAVEAAGRSTPELVPAALPAARHALETALAELEARERGVPTWQLFRERVDGVLPVAGLVDTVDRTRAVAQASALVARGASALKLKVGREPAEDVAQRVLAVIAQAGVPVRLDANRSLSPAVARELARLLPGAAVEFFEEPVPPAALSDLADFPIPLALDETLAEGVTDFGPAQVLVLKPMALGGVEPCLALSRCAAERGLSVVVSHSFDGPYAMAAARALALALGPGRPADGLGPHAVLRAWPGALPLHLLEPALAAWHSPGSGIDP